MALFKKINLPIFGDERGSLISLESERIAPFPIQRIYYIFGTMIGVSRGFHAHKQTKQLLICISGSCRLVFNDGESREEVILNANDYGITIDKMIWHEMHDFTDQCILLVLASDYFDEADYIRNFDDYLKILGRK